MTFRTRSHPRTASAAFITRAITAAAALAWAFTALASPATPASADVSDFSYASWDVDYTLDTDANGRAITRVTETLVAEFPMFNQNRGIVRGLPIKYEGTSTNPSNFSVTDASGADVPFEVESEDGFVAVLTGDDSYVQGEQTYVISYTLHDTVLARSDGQADEFYWDLVDFEHEQPIDQFAATISFGPGLADRLNGNTRCYVGGAGSTAECEITQSAYSDEATYEITGVQLGPREGVTAAIGLDAGAVVQPPARLPNFTLDTLPLFVGATALGTAGVAAVSTIRLRKRRRLGRGTIVPQYDVPDRLPPVLAGPIAGVPAPTAPAELVHLAVRGAIRIEDGQPEQTFFGRLPAQPVLRIMDPERAVDPLDVRMMDTVFPTGTPGEAVVLPRKSTSFGSLMQQVQSVGAREAVTRGYFEKVANPVARRWGWVSLGLVVVLAAMTVASLVLRHNALAVAFILAGVCAAVIAIISMVKQRVYTPFGAETREYLEGVRLFIRVAEADRIRMLQSHSGAERYADGTVNVVHLYERLLPYAMLFGLEKEWTRVLQVAYESQPGFAPAWYPAVGLAGMSNFTSTISQFTNSLTSSVSYTSSSSGGSSGGGFSGGGGGGGFSGGR